MAVAVGRRGDARWVFLDGEVYVVEVERAAAARRARRASTRPRLAGAPMPATVVRASSSAPAGRRRGDTLLVLEAMKMELPSRARATAWSRGALREGELVQPGVALVDLEW